MLLLWNFIDKKLNNCPVSSPVGPQKLVWINLCLCLRTLYILYEIVLKEINFMKYQSVDKYLFLIHSSLEVSLELFSFICSQCFKI